MKAHHILIPLACLVLLSACAPPPPPVAGTPGPAPALAEAATPSPTPSPAPTATPVETVESATRGELAPMPQDPVVERLIQRAKEDLAAWRRVRVDEIQVAQVEAVTWPDSSLGCPKPGYMYAQVLTPGYRIVLSAQGRTYEYHTASDPEGPLVRC